MSVIDLRPVHAPRRLQLFAAVKTRAFACIYYRVEVPFRTAEDLGEADSDIIEITSLTKAVEESTAGKADIHLYWMLLGDTLNNHLERLRGMSRQYDSKLQRWVSPPRAVFDSDDDAEHVDQFNPRFANLGTMKPDESGPLPVGAKVETLINTPRGQERVTLWEDGVGDFDLADNLKRLKALPGAAKESSGVTVSTPYLADVYRDRYECENVYVFPNSIRFDDYPDINIHRNPKTVNILYQGGWSHFRDICPFPAVLGRVARKYSHARFIFWGQKFEWMASEIPPTQRQHLRWVPYDAYKLRLCTLDVDINLAPLAHRMFNKTKSAIKFYEAASTPQPAVTLASNYGPYEEIQDGNTGMTFTQETDPATGDLLPECEKEFEEKLCTLIEDATLRKRLAENAKDWIKDNRDAFITVPPLLEWYRRLQDG